MKNLVKILSVGIACLLLITSFFFIPKNKLETTSAINTMSITSDYDGELSTDYYGLGDFAIENISSFMYSDGFYFKFSCSVSSAYQYLFGLVSSDYFTSPRYFDYFIVNSTGFNMCVVCRSGSIAFESKTAITYNGSSYYALNAFNMSANTNLDFYFSNYNFTVDSNKNVSIISTLSISSTTQYKPDFSSIVDMNSQTEFSYETSILNFDGYGNEFVYDLFSNLYNKSTTSFLGFGTYSFKDSQNVSCFSSRNGTISNYNVFAYYSFYVRGFLVGSFDASAVLNSLKFEILRPSYRVNNSLIFYNYDYLKSFSSCEEISYTLRKNNDLYNVNYMGPVPNSKYVQISSQEVNNIVFDEYISLKLNFNPLMERISDSFYVVDDIIVFENSLGFDFNFSYYVQPLVSNTSSYNYEFKKPSYKDGSIKLSIAPPKLDIPVLAWAENILIFFLFYCPVISDLIEFIHFDKFFAVLLQIFDIYTSSALGDFVLSCFAFILFWNMLALIMPRFVQTSSKIYEDSQLNYNISERRKEKKLHKYNEKKKHYLHKQIDKEYKLKEKRKKKGLPD